VCAAGQLPELSAEDYSKNTVTPSLTHKFSEHIIYYSVGKILDLLI
jgi:hypothetical protein